MVYLTFIVGHSPGHKYSMFKTWALAQAWEYLCFDQPSAQLCADERPQVQSNQ